MHSSPSKKQLREFGLVIGIGFPLVLGWLLPALFQHQFRAWTLWIAVPALLLGFLAPGLLAWPYRGWMALGHAMGWVNSHVILGVVFFFVVLPISFCMSLFGHDPLRRKVKRAHESYRESTKHHKADLRRIF